MIGWIRSFYKMIRIIIIAFIIIAQQVFSYVEKKRLGEIKKAIEEEERIKSVKLEEEKRERQRYEKKLQLIREQDQLNRLVEEERERQRALLIFRSKYRLF